MELQVTTKGAFLLTRPYTGEAWEVVTYYKDNKSIRIFTVEAEADKHATAYANNTGDIAVITKILYQDGQQYARG